MTNMSPIRAAVPNSLGYGLGMVHILSCGTERHHRVDVTYPCSSPACAP